MIEPIRILSENPLEQVWLHLSRLECVALASKAVAARVEASGQPLSHDVLQRKAVGVAYTLRSARDYMTSSSDSPTKRVLSSYYAMMSFLSAVLIADPTSSYDLDELERATKMGHGLGSVDDDAAAFPVAQKVYVTNNGFLHRYLKHAGIEANDVNISTRFSRVQDLKPADAARLVSLDELLARIPELTEFYFTVTGRVPLAAHVAFSEMLDEHGQCLDPILLPGGDRPAPSKSQVVVVRAVGVPATTPEAITKHLGMPLRDVRLRPDLVSGKEELVGTVDVPPDRSYWYEVLATHKSPMCPRSWFRPLFGAVTDPIVLHFCTLYVLSIIVRYRPKLWREITEGELTEYLALLRSYLTVVERVVPELVLTRVLEREVVCMQPGSFLAPL